MMKIPFIMDLTASRVSLLLPATADHVVVLEIVTESEAAAPLFPPQFLSSPQSSSTETEIFWSCELAAATATSEIWSSA